MTPPPNKVRPELKVRVPRHVVHRDFPAQTVILNLETGKYHGLNPTAGTDALRAGDRGDRGRRREGRGDEDERADRGRRAGPV